MRVLIQRVTSSAVAIAGQPLRRIGPGLTLLVGIAPTDTTTEVTWMARKCLDLRLFPDATGQPWAQSVQEIGGALLVVSQFTLYGDGRKGRRPSFSGSARPDQAEVLYDRFVALLRESGLTVATGQFGAMMQVEIHNDGPVTLWLERDAPAPPSQTP